MIVKKRLIMYLVVLVEADLMSGLSTYMKSVSPETKMIGVEPEGAASMKESFTKQVVTPLDSIDSFVDGAAVACVGEKTLLYL